MDPYQVLGIRPDADTGQIRTAYRRRARYVHPDAGGDDDAFTRLQDAYRRALHLRSARRPGPPPPPPAPSRPGAGTTTARSDGRSIAVAAARLWAGHQLSVVMMLVTQVVALSVVVLVGPPSSPLAAVVAALLAGVGAGYALSVGGVVVGGLSWRLGGGGGRATPRARWQRASGPRRR